MNTLILLIFLFLFGKFSPPVYAQIKEWGDCVVNDVPTLKCIEVVFNNILFMSSALVVVVLFIMFLVGGFTYLASFGNPERIKKAQGTLRWAIVGFVLFLSAFLILNIIDIMFLGGNGDIFNLNIGE